MGRNRRPPIPRTPQFEPKLIKPRNSIMTTSPDEPKKQHPVVGIISFILGCVLIYYCVKLFCL